MARSCASEPRIALVMGFGGDADVGMLQDVSTLRIERGQALQLLPQKPTFCCGTTSVVLGRLCCKSGWHLVRSPKTGNIKIRKAEFLNQNSLFGLDPEKVFFAPRPKIVLQHHRPCMDGARVARSNLTFLRSVRVQPCIRPIFAWRVTSVAMRPQWPLALM